jgi:hypothetical protein
MRGLFSDGAAVAGLFAPPEPPPQALKAIAAAAMQIGAAQRTAGNCISLPIATQQITVRARDRNETLLDARPFTAES